MAPAEHSTGRQWPSAAPFHATRPGCLLPAYAAACLLPAYAAACLLPTKGTRTGVLLVYSAHPGAPWYASSCCLFLQTQGGCTEASSACATRAGSLTSGTRQGEPAGASRLPARSEPPARCPGLPNRGGDQDCGHQGAQRPCGWTLLQGKEEHVPALGLPEDDGCDAGHANGRQPKLSRRRVRRNSCKPRSRVSPP